MTPAMERAGWKDFDERLAASKTAGKIRGIGMATYIEACAFPGSEPAFVELNGDGTVTLKIGTQTNGQGHATAYAQIVAEKLNIDDREDHHAPGRHRRSRERRRHRRLALDPARRRLGVARRRGACRKDQADRRRRAGGLAADIELHDGTARIVGTDRSMSFAAIAKAAKKPEDLQGFGEFVQDEATYPNGTHICEVEIDPETGATEIVGYTIVDDFGVTVNPILLAGQVHGGVVQGIGQALSEDTVYGEDGQLLTASFMDYAMPRADRFSVLPFRDAQRAVDHQRAWASRAPARPARSARRRPRSTR